MLRVTELSVSFGSMQILSNISFTVRPGTWLMIAGPNGAGKSTLLNAVSGGIPYTGLVEANGRDIRKQKPAELARFMGMLMQNHRISYSFTVGEIVAMGRYSHGRGIFRSSDPEGSAATEAALRKTGLTALRNQSVTRLSGGELQRTFLAQLLCQDTRLMLLDEPTNHLDLIYQKQVFELIQGWLAETRGSVISVVHDLSLARHFGTEALLLSGGKQIALGPARQALSTENLSRVYGIDVKEWFTALGKEWL